jgi:hypothetical protein
MALGVAVWVSPLFNPPSVFRAGLVTPVLILLFLACVIDIAREEATTALVGQSERPARRRYQAV